MDCCIAHCKSGCSPWLQAQCLARNSRLIPLRPWRLTPLGSYPHSIPILCGFLMPTFCCKIHPFWQLLFSSWIGGIYILGMWWFFLPPKRLFSAMLFPYFCIDLFPFCPQYFFCWGEVCSCKDGLEGAQFELNFFQGVCVFVCVLRREISWCVTARGLYFVWNRVWGYR